MFENIKSGIVPKWKRVDCRGQFVLFRNFDVGSLGHQGGCYLHLTKKDLYFKIKEVEHASGKVYMQIKNESIYNREQSPQPCV